MQHLSYQHEPVVVQEAHAAQKEYHAMCVRHEELGLRESMKDGDQVSLQNPERIREDQNTRIEPYKPHYDHRGS